MSATVPITWVDGQMVNKDLLNTEIRDAFNDLRDGAGVIKSTRVPDLGATYPFQHEFFQGGVLVIGPGTKHVYNSSGRALTIITTRASVTVAPVGASIIVDITKNGTSIFTNQANRPTIIAGAFTALGGTPDLLWANGEYLTVDIDSVGSSTPGSELQVQVLAR